MASFTHKALEGGYPAAGTLHGTLFSCLGCCLLILSLAKSPDITMLTKCISVIPCVLL